MTPSHHHSEVVTSLAGDGGGGDITNNNGCSPSPSGAALPACYADFQHLAPLSSPVEHAWALQQVPTKAGRLVLCSPEGVCLGADSVWLVWQNQYFGQPG